MKDLRVLIAVLAVVFSFAAQAEYGIVETEDGSIYASVGRQQGTDYLVSYNYVNCRLFCSRSSRSFRIPTDNVTFPTESLEVQTQGATRTLSAGSFFLGQDERMYVVENVFADGRIVAQPVEVNPVSRFRLNDSFAPIQNENPVIMTGNDVRAVQVRCFLGVCEGQRYGDIEGAPLCDLQNLRAALVRDQVVQGIPERLICGKDHKAPIYAVFSDGTLANFNVLFNPFPSTIDRYYRVTEDHSAVETDGSESQAEL